MKVIAAYNIFNGLELFHKSVEYTRPYVDEVVFIYQTVSYRGNANPNVLDHIEQYPDIKSFEFKPDLSFNPKQNELNKQNMMINICRDRGASHMILVDCDHIYEPDKFKAAIDKSKQYDVTFTGMLTYYKYPTWQLTPPENYFMPFLIKLYPSTQFMRQNNYPVLVDPTLRVNTCGNYYVFPMDEFLLHHYSMVRADINEKFQNSPSQGYGYWQQHGYVDEWFNYDLELNPGVKYFHGRKIKVVDNYFDI